MERAIQSFVSGRLAGETAPPDLDILLKAFSARQNFAQSTENPLTHAATELMWTDRTYSLLDHDYLNETDRENPDIMANVKAMQDTAEKLKFVAQSEDDFLLGYWQERPETPLAACSLFWLDSEGQYSIAEGKSLAETLAYRALVDGDEELCGVVTQTFEQLGIIIPVAKEDLILSEMDTRSSAIAQTPQDYRGLRYKHYRQASG